MTHQTSWFDGTGVCGVQQKQAGGSFVWKRAQCVLTDMAMMSACWLPSKVHAACFRGELSEMTHKAGCVHMTTPLHATATILLYALVSSFGFMLICTFSAGAS